MINISIVFIKIAFILFGNLTHDQFKMQTPLFLCKQLFDTFISSTAHRFDKYDFFFLIAKDKL